MIKKLMHMMIQNVYKIIFIVMGVVICVPIILVITGSVMGSTDLKECLEPVFLQEQGFVTWKLIPQYPTIGHFRELLIETPQFFILFWNSIKLVGLILIGQMLVGVPAAWAFAVYQVRGKKLLFTIYIVLMLLPFQVTMFSNYLVLKELELLNTHWSVILPAIFNTFPVFIAYGSFRTIPKPLIEAARIDGASELYIFIKIGLPLGKGSILSAIVLGFLEYWNMIEQPLAFLEDKFLWPLSLYLPEIDWTQAGMAFSASVIMLIPAVFVFMMGNDYLEQGIIYSGLKQ